MEIFCLKESHEKVSESVSFIFWVWENCWRVRRRGREAGRLAECSPYHLPPPDLPECCPHGSAPLPVFHNIPPRNRQRASPAAAAAYNCWANCSCLAAAAGAGRAAADLAATEEEHNCPSIWIGWYWRHQVIKSALIPSRGQLAVVSSSRDSWPCESRGMSALPHSRTSGLHTALQWAATAGGGGGHTNRWGEARSSCQESELITWSPMPPPTIPELRNVKFFTQTITWVQNFTPKTRNLRLICIRDKTRKSWSIQVVVGLVCYVRRPIGYLHRILVECKCAWVKIIP